MKKNVFIILLFPLLALTACKEETNTLQNTQEAAKYFEAELAHKVNPGSVKRAIQTNDPNIVIIDLRKRAQYAEGHVPGAINLPFDEWHSFDGTKADFSELDPTKMHYVYCYELYCNLSVKAALLLAQNGYPVKEVRGGFKAYKEHNYLIEQ